MKTAWITYAWNDNKSKDVDFVAQELVRAGLEIKLDRWNLNAGARLWDQIDRFIQSKDECDAWILYATQESLGSGPCREEYAYALERAINRRGEEFPVIAIFPGAVDTSVIPAGIRTRLYVSLTDVDWKERVVSAAEARAPNIAKPEIAPYYLKVHKNDDGFCYIEVRPRAGSWSPFLAAIPIEEKEIIQFSLYYGANGNPPKECVLFNVGNGTSQDGKWFYKLSQNESTPTMSYYIRCNHLPSKLLFGADKQPRYVISEFNV